MKTMQMLGISGSIREDSYHRALLRNAVDLVPQSANLSLFENLAEIPPFNQDLEMKPPRVVREFKDRIKTADAILFATPEYNYSIPGVLKNAIDWASRPYGDNAWEGKPVGIMSGSLGIIGGARVQYQLRQVFVFLNMHSLNRPEVIIPMIQDKFDDNHQLIDEHTRDKVREMLGSLVNWTIELREGEKAAEKIAAEEYQYQHAYNRTADGADKENDQKWIRNEMKKIDPFFQKPTQDIETNLARGVDDAIPDADDVPGGVDPEDAPENDILQSIGTADEEETERRITAEKLNR